MAWLLIAATIPAALIGFGLEGFIEDSFHGDNDAARLAIAGFLVVGAIALWLADRFGSQRRELRDVTTSTALAIGLSQALALLPGISRSGATITAARALGMNREAAARFSFLLATPITLGAGLYGSRRLLTETHTGVEWLAIGVGFTVAVLSGLLAIGFLLAWLRRRSLAIFSLYRVGFAAVIVVLVVAGR
jgi:undecaprenyl-diphosphatase